MSTTTSIWSPGADASTARWRSGLTLGGATQASGSLHHVEFGESVGARTERHLISADDEGVVWRCRRIGGGGAGHPAAQGQHGHPYSGDPVPIRPGHGATPSRVMFERAWIAPLCQRSRRVETVTWRRIQRREVTVM
jgi:hypothetical protein